MDAVPRSHLLAAVALVALALFAGSRLMGERARAEEPAPVRIDARATSGAPGAERRRLVVHVAGAVREPGVYGLPAGSRVDDAVRRAGGPSRRADLSGLNLAAELEDGRQVLVPQRARAAAPVAPGAASGAPPATTDAASAPINLNTATLEQLDTLDGVGPATAQKILDWRTEHGGFGSVEELGQIPGIGQKRMATLRAQLTV